MRVLDRKVLRDIVRLWAQALAVSLVMACGVATLLTSLGAYRSLEETRTVYYERYRFGDVFASLKRAPRSLGDRIAEIPHVAAVEMRVADYVLLDIEGMVEPASGLALSLPDHRDPAVNLPVIREGRLPEPGNPDEIAVSEAFAEAHRFGIGSRFHAILNGTKRHLVIRGIVLSPEFIYALGPGDLMPDPRRFGILYFSERALSGLLDFDAAFNDVSLRLLRGANERDVLARLDTILAPYGGVGAYPRADQTSNAFIDGELKQLQSMSGVIPPIFLCVAAFLINMVLSRMIALEREQIGLFKAIGYGTLDIAFHYIKLVLVISALGIGIGFGVGTWLGRGLIELYGKFFDFPFLIFSTHADIYVIAAGVSLFAAVAGGLKAVWSTVALSPAVAMQPPKPGLYRANPLERLGLTSFLSRLTVMGLRHLIRHPVRSGLTMLGMAFAVGLLVTSMFFLDVNRFLTSWIFEQSERQNASVALSSESAPEIVAAIARLPGVLMTERSRTVSATLRLGHRHRRLAITGIRPDAQLSRIVDRNGVAVEIADAGLTLGDRVAKVLHVRRGDMISVELLQGKRRKAMVPVSQIAPGFLGMNVFMDADALDRLAGTGPRVGSVHILLDVDRTEDLYRAVKGMPGIASLVLFDVTRERFDETLEENTTIMATIYIVLSIVIAFGVTYNAARIQLSERARELASLRVLGFTSGEVFGVLLAELGMIVALAQPLGWGIGAGISWLVVTGFESDLYRIPLVFETRTFAVASLVVLAASSVSALIVRRRVTHLDLIRVLKTRD